MILVFGATGTVGSQLVAQLVAAGEGVRVFTRDRQRAAKVAGTVDVIEGDLNDTAAVAAAMRGVERFFLLTSETDQDRTVLAAARQVGARHVVKLSTQEAGWTPVVGHGHWHREREDLIRASGLAWTFLRPCMFMDFALTWSPSITTRGLFETAGGDGKLAPIDPWDVARVAKAALTEPGHENVGYELTGPELLSFADMAAVLSTVIGRPVRHAHISAAAQRDVFVRMGVPDYVATGLSETFSLIEADRFAHLTDDVERATGAPARSFATWAREHASAFG